MKNQGITGVECQVGGGARAGRAVSCLSKQSWLKKGVNEGEKGQQSIDCQSNS